MRVERLPLTRDSESRELKILQLHSHREQSLPQPARHCPQADRVPPDVIGLLDEVPQVLVVIVAPVLAVRLEAAVRQYPSEERRGELVVVGSVGFGARLSNAQDVQQVGQ